MGHFQRSKNISNIYPTDFARNIHSFLLVNQFGQVIGSNYLSLSDNTTLTSDTTLYCITENKNTPDVVWSYQDLAKRTTSTLGSYTSTTTGVSSIPVYNSSPGYYSCSVKVNGGGYKTYTALVAHVNLSTGMYVVLSLNIA